jgi:predicted CopG family antitoxin
MASHKSRKGEDIMKTETGKVKIVITLRDDVYCLLEEMCRRDNRSKSNEISWVIKQGKGAISAEQEKEKNIIRPNLSVWKREAV